MRSIEDEGCLTNGTPQEVSGGTSCMSFEFQKSNNGANRPSHNHRAPLGKPTPSKWDDAQKWLVNLSRGEKNLAKASPRNSNADDRRLIAPMPKKDYLSDEDEGGNVSSESNGLNDVETKNVDSEQSIWRVNKPVNSSKSIVLSVSVRDMGTEMTPIASQEPSRTATPIRSTTPRATSPVASGSSSPVRCPNGAVSVESGHNAVAPSETRVQTTRPNDASRLSRDGDEVNGEKIIESDQPRKLNPLETRALAWDEAERAKYMARYKREEVKIQAWENHQKRRAEMEMKKIEVKAERLKSRAQEKYTNKITSTRRIAEEKRVKAEAKLNEKAVNTSERAYYIRRTGHLPSSFSIRLPSICW